MLEAEAAERSRKFALVQRSFRSTETELREQMEALTEEAQAAKLLATKCEIKVRIRSEANGGDKPLDQPI